MLSRNFIIPCSVVLVIVACANPLNQATSDRYAATCSAAEQQRQLAVAEEACYRALVNVEMGNLGPELKSQRLYNLARIKRAVGKFSEAEPLLKQSLSLEESLTGHASLQVGRRLVELSVNLAAQDKWLEGAPYLARATPLVGLFSPAERAFTKSALETYAPKLQTLGRKDEANAFAAAAAKL